MNAIVLPARVERAIFDGGATTYRLTTREDSRGRVLEISQWVAPGGSLVAERRTDADGVVSYWTEEDSP